MGHPSNARNIRVSDLCAPHIYAYTKGEPQMEKMNIADYRKLAGEPNKKVQNQIKGAVNRRNGQLFEGLIQSACIRYEMDDVAYIEKTPEPMRPISGQRRDGSFIAVFEKKAQADYKGTLKGGKAIGFEAKHTEADRIKREAVSDEQEKCLDKMMNMGAVCFVLVSFGFRSFYKVPWGVWKNMKQIYGRKYLKPEDIEQYKVEHIGYLKFLG